MSGYPSGSRKRGIAADMAAKRKEMEREVEAARDREAQVARALNGRTPQAVVDFDGVAPLIEMLVQATGRAIRCDVLDPKRMVTQRCRACNAEIKTRVADDWQTSLAHAIRFDYDSHRCAPIDIQLHGCNNDELTKLLEETEQELERVAKRAAAIQFEIRRRG